MTALICGRILQIRQWHRSISASPQNGASSSGQWARAVTASYTGMVAIIAESALPSTFFGVAYLITFAIKSDISIFLLSIYSMFTVSAASACACAS